jgi:hypothetical protein
MTILSASAALVLALLLLLAPRPAAAQSELMQWLDPRLGNAFGRADYRVTFFPDRKVDEQPTDLGFIQHNVTLVVPIWQDSRDEWMVSGRLRYQDYDTRAILPDDGRRFPHELWDVRFGGSYRHLFDNGWTAGASFTIGSASDEPFHSTDELIVSAAGLLRVPHRARNAWLFSLYYSNTQEFLGGIPIPGIAYHWVPSDRFNAVVGVPFTSVEYRPLDKLTLDFLYAPVRRVRARATYRPFRPLRAYIGFDWDYDAYFLAKRRDEDDRLFMYDKRVIGGIRFDLRYVGVELYGGYVFDRFYFEGESYSDRRDNRIDIASGPFVGFRIGGRWGRSISERQ